MDTFVVVAKLATLGLLFSKGYTQLKGLNFMDTFVVVAKLTTHYSSALQNNYQLQVDLQD